MEYFQRYLEQNLKRNVHQYKSSYDEPQKATQFEIFLVFLKEFVILIDHIQTENNVAKGDK
jgi:hypothetical protein